VDAPVTIRRQAYWSLILAVIGVDLWWSSTPSSFALWWIPVIALNAACLVLVLRPLVRGAP
jgi:hydrogenase-4 membrane subunit HyfE